MTAPADLARLAHRIINSADIIEARLPTATTALQRNAATGYPTVASGNARGGRGEAELTPTEAAAHTNTGDIYGYDTTYRPGPTTRLSDIADELHAALKSLDRAHRALTDCGIAPLDTRHLHCHGINGRGCPDWRDTSRTDGLCIDCGRAVDSNRRRLRRHAAS